MKISKVIEAKGITNQPKRKRKKRASNHQRIDEISFLRTEKTITKASFYQIENK